MNADLQAQLNEDEIERERLHDLAQALNDLAAQALSWAVRTAFPNNSCLPADIGTAAARDVHKLRRA